MTGQNAQNTKNQRTGTAKSDSGECMEHKAPENGNTEEHRMIGDRRERIEHEEPENRKHRAAQSDR